MTSHEYYITSHKHHMTSHKHCMPSSHKHCMTSHSFQLSLPLSLHQIIQPMLQGLSLSHTQLVIIVSLFSLLNSDIYKGAWDTSHRRLSSLLCYAAGYCSLDPNLFKLSGFSDGVYVVCCFYGECGNWYWLCFVAVVLVMNKAIHMQTDACTELSLFCHGSKA